MLSEEIKICVTQKSRQAEAKSNLAGADTKHDKNRDISPPRIFGTLIYRKMMPSKLTGFGLREQKFCSSG